MTKRRIIIDPYGSSPQTVLLSHRDYRLGRNRVADIRLSSKNVSGFHCSLHIGADEVRIIDLDSTNGTFVNGKRIRKAALSNGDIITLGDCTLRYEETATETHAGGHVTETLYRLPDEKHDDRIESLFAELKKSGAAAEAVVTELISELEFYRRNSRLLETLYSLLERVLVISDRDAAVALLLRELRLLLGLEIASLYLAYENRFAILEGDRVEWSDDYPVASRSVLRKVIESRQPMVIEQVDDGSNSMKTLLRFKIRSALCFPVLSRDGTVQGAVYCVSRQSGQLYILRDDSHFINACSVFIALVLENLQMIEREKKAASAEARRSEERRFTPIISRLRQERENLALKLGPAGDEFFGLECDEYKPLREFMVKAAPTCLPVLITGETGTGKSLFAKALHLASGVAGPFVVIDCTTIPHELLESELFGHEKGAFTGAHTDKYGKVRSADGGTLFIDEIGELDAALQAKLLRFIQSGEYEPLGATATRHSTARLIAATNIDLKAGVAQKRFREDLYYRLNVLAIELPPLRNLPGMVLQLADHFRARYAPRLNPSADAFTPAAIRLLTSHRWPGNIRELENTVMRALVNAQQGAIDAEHLALEPEVLLPLLSHELPSSATDDRFDLKAARERIDRVLISQAIAATGRNVSRAAEMLKISRNSLMDLMKKYGL